MMLVPELRNSEWTHEFTEVDSDEHPLEMSWGWLIESYEFYHEPTDVRLTANIESDHQNPSAHEYSVYIYVDGEQEDLSSCRCRKAWWQEIKQIMSFDDINEVFEK
jgi:hypothetical protein